MNCLKSFVLGGSILFMSCTLSFVSMFVVPRLNESISLLIVWGVFVFFCGTSVPILLHKYMTMLEIYHDPVANRREINIIY